MAEEMQQIVLASYCSGPPQLQNFRLEITDLPIPRDGQFRVRHIWNSVDPGTRSRLSGGDSYASAAGPVGATAGQLAKALGAGQVIGIAGSQAKCDWLVEEAGFDAAINYKAASDLDADISAAMPDGIDLLFDNVGNEMINRVLPKMRLNGRICVSGQVADYNLTPQETPGIVHTRPFITHRIAMQGLVVFDFAREFPQALSDMAAMIAAGQLKLKEETFVGIESMPAAFCGLFRGENFGRRVVQIGEICWRHISILYSRIITASHSNAKDVS